MNKYNFLFFFCLLSLNSFSEVKIEQPIIDEFAMLSDSKLNYYFLQASPYSESDALAKIEKLKPQGFTWTEKKSLGENIIFQNGNVQYLFYNTSKSEYRYFNSLVGQITPQNEKDTAHLRKLADGYISDLLTDDAKNYVFTNDEREYQVLKDDGLKRMISITYHFVKIVDGRQIRGLSCGVFITLGADGKIKRFKINTQKVVKGDVLKRQMKVASMKIYLTNYLNSDEYTKNIELDSITSVKIWKFIPCYFMKMVGTTQVLVPNISFFSRNTLTNGKVMRRETRLSLDPADIPNVSNADITENVIEKK